MKSVSKLLPASRAGMLTHSAMRMKRDIENERLKPLIIMGLIPLCSAQYERLFGTCRIPGQEAGMITIITSQFSKKRCRDEVPKSKQTKCRDSINTKE